MAQKNKRQKAGKAKKKLWFEVVGPESFSSILIGETAALEPSELPGRTLSVNLMTLTNDAKSQHVNVKFRISDVKGTKAIATPIKYEIIPAHIKRMVRRRRNRVDDVFMAMTKDERVVTVKVLMVTRQRTTNAVQTALRHEAKRVLFSHIKKNDYESVFKDIVFGRIQKLMKQKLGRIYPLRSAEVRIFQLEEKKKFVPPVMKQEQASQKAKKAEAKKEAQKEEHKSGADKEEKTKKQEQAEPKEKPAEEAAKVAEEEKKQGAAGQGAAGEKRRLKQNPRNNSSAYQL